MSKSEWDRASSPGFHLSLSESSPRAGGMCEDTFTLCNNKLWWHFYAQLGCMLQVFFISHKLQLWNPRSRNFTSDFPQHQLHPAEGLQSGFPSLPLSIRNMETISVCCSHSPTLCFLILFVTFCLPALRAPQGLWCTLCSQCKSRFFFHITEVPLDQINTCTKHKVWQYPVSSQMWSNISAQIIRKS